MSAVDEIRPAPAARRISLFWIAIWTAFLIEPLEAGWRLRDEPAGWLGIAATLAFGVWYVACFAWLRRRAWALTTVGPRRTALVLGVAFVLSLVVCLLLGQHGTATSVYICVLVVVLLPRPRSLAAAGVVAAGYYLSGFIVPGWERSNGLLLSMLTASIRRLRDHGDGRERPGAAPGDRREPAPRRRQRAQPLRPRPARHPRALAHGDHRQGRARRPADRHRPGPGQGRGRRPGAAQPRCPRRRPPDRLRLSRRHPLRRAGPGPRCAGHGRDRGGDPERHRRRTDPAAGALRLDRPRGRHQRHPALRSEPLRDPALGRPGEVRDDGRGAGADSGAGAGLVGLRERAEAVGATVVTRSLEPGFSLSVVSR